MLGRYKCRRSSATPAAALRYKILTITLVLRDPAAFLNCQESVG